MDDAEKSPLRLLERAQDVWSDRARPAGEDIGWHLRERVVWPTQDWLEELGPRGQIGVFGGGGIASAAVIAALVIGLSGGSGSSGGTTEAFVLPQTPAPVIAAPTAKPKVHAAKPTGPTLHGAAPDFSAAKEVKAGVGNGKAVEKQQKTSAPASEGPVERGSSSGETPAATAKIAATPAASASAQAQADSLATASSAGVAEAGKGSGKGAGLNGPPAPKAAKQVARRFAEAFVVYEIGGIDTGVRKTFGQTSTKQLSRSLLHRPPRQPAGVEVPQAKVVNVVAGPSHGTTYSVSVSLLRVGVTSELRLELEQGVGKKWQVTNVLG
jgi:hypothetical protein